MRRILPILIIALGCVAAIVPTRPSTRDDAAYLQRILERGGVVTLAPGVYRPVRPVVLNDVTDLVVFGYGVTIQADPKQPIDNGNTGDTLQLNRCRRVIFLGLNFDGNRAARGGFNLNPETVRLYCCSDVRLRDCSFANDVCDGVFAWTGNPAVLPACERVTIESCRFSNPGRNGVSLVNAAWSSVINCDFDGPGGDPGVAVDVEANAQDPAGIDHHVTLAFNRCRNLRGGLWVIKTAGPSGVTVLGNQLDAIAGDAIFNEGSNALVMANNVTDCGRAGISCPKPGSMTESANNASVYRQDVKP